MPMDAIVSSLAFSINQFQEQNFSAIAGVDNDGLCVINKLESKLLNNNFFYGNSDRLSPVIQKE